MPIHEADPWRMQYFEGIPSILVLDCGSVVQIIPGESDSWSANR